MNSSFLNFIGITLFCLYCALVPGILVFTIYRGLVKYNRRSFAHEHDRSVPKPNHVLYIVVISIIIYVSEISLTFITMHILDLLVNRMDAVRSINSSSFLYYKPESLGVFLNWEIYLPPFVVLYIGFFKVSHSPTPTTPTPTKSGGSSSASFPSAPQAPREPQYTIGGEDNKEIGEGLALLFGGLISAASGYIAIAIAIMIILGSCS